jgi:hypothetical protein
MLSAEFKLEDGRTARVSWVNGPPYLSVTYTEKKLTKEEQQKAVEEAAKKGYDTLHRHSE